MRINFLLPFYSRIPIGGFRVHYEYASRLASRGHSVTVIHPCTVEEPHGSKARVAHFLKRGKDILNNRKGVGWMPIHGDVELKAVPHLAERFIPDADVTVATSWATAEMAKSYSLRLGKKFQIVYDYEQWMTATPASRARMQAAFRSGLKVIATSPSVGQMLTENGVEPVAYIPCGVDFEMFRIEVPIEQRPWGTIGLPLRSHPSKGLTDVLNAARILNGKFGDKLTFKGFGPEPVKDLPDWIHPTWLPTDRDLRTFLNSISIFVFPSLYEGWGLPGIEALACGAALVATDSVGISDYAKHGRSALVVERSRPDLLAEAVAALLADDVLRQRLARQGHEMVQQYSWTSSVNTLESVFSEH